VPCGYDDFPKTDDPVYILGEQYSAIYGKGFLQKWGYNSRH